jgi:hypothetical protein
MESDAIVAAIDERPDVFPQTIEVAVLARALISSRLSVFMKLSQLALSYGFPGRLMLGIMPCFRKISTYSPQAYRMPRSE